MEAGIAPLVIALNKAGIRTVSSCEGHMDPAYVTTVPLLDKDAEALRKLLQQALSNISLEDVKVRAQQVQMPADAPFQGRTILWLDNFQKLLPWDKERVAKKMAKMISKTIDPQG